MEFINGSLQRIVKADNFFLLKGQVALVKLLSDGPNVECAGIHQRKEAIEKSF